MSFAAFLAYIACSFLRPFELLAPGLAPYRPMVWLLGIALATAIVRPAGASSVGARAVHFKLLAAFTFAVGTSELANGNLGSVLPAIADFSTSGMLMLLCFLNVTSLRRLETTCAVLSACVLILAGLALISYHSGWRVEDFVIRQYTGEGYLLDGAEVDMVPATDSSGTILWRLRGLGFLNDPNDFAQALLMVMPLLWWAYKPGHPLRAVVLVFAPGAIAAYSLYLTHSRGGLLAVLAMLYFGVQRALGAARTLMLLAALLLAASYSGFGGGREINSGEQSAGDRIDAWADGLSMLRSHPIFGVGYGEFTEHHERTAHNSFVLCFSELGLFGYFAWMGMIVIAYRGLASMIDDPSGGAEQRRAASCLRAALVAFLASAWFLSRSYSPGLYVVLALSIAARSCAQTGIANGPGTSIEALPPWRFATLLAICGSLLLVYGFVVTHYAGG
jgi:putative inorganic carbon (hco3(-)) transporter